MIYSDWFHVKANLARKQSEFAENQQYMIKPSLTPTTWHGNWATSFDDIRRNGILESYNEIQKSQFNTTFAVIVREMEEIRQEIQRILQIIAQLLAAEK